MKKLAIMLVLVLCCFAICTSCGETDRVKFDESLAGSISYIYEAKVDGTYDGVLLIDDCDSKDCRTKECDINKISKKKVTFRGVFVWRNEEFVITIPDFPVYGKPYDVTFDHVVPKSKAQHNDVEYNDITASIKGWMKRTTGEMSLTRTIAYPNYNCNITINCAIDGKELILKITKLRGVAL